MSTTNLQTLEQKNKVEESQTYKWLTTNLKEDCIYSKAFYPIFKDFEGVQYYNLLFFNNYTSELIGNDHYDKLARDTQFFQYSMADTFLRIHALAFGWEVGHYFDRKLDSMLSNLAMAVSPNQAIECIDFMVLANFLRGGEITLKETLMVNHLKTAYRNLAMLMEKN